MALHARASDSPVPDRFPAEWRLVPSTLCSRCDLSPCLRLLRFFLLPEKLQQPSIKARRPQTAGFALPACCHGASAGLPPPPPGPACRLYGAQRAVNLPGEGVRGQEPRQTTAPVRLHLKFFILKLSSKLGKRERAELNLLNAKAKKGKKRGLSFRSRTFRDREAFFKFKRLKPCQTC